MPNTQNLEQKDNLVKILRDAKALYLVDFRGLSVPEITELRRRLRKEEVVFKVIKNTIAKRAFDEVGFEELGKTLLGPNAVLISYGDEIQPLKTIYNFSKEYKKLEFKYGLLEGKILTRDEMLEIAKLPSAEELQGKVVSVLNSPISSLVWTLKSTLSSMVHLLQSIIEKKSMNGKETNLRLKEEI